MKAHCKKCGKDFEVAKQIEELINRQIIPPLEICLQCAINQDRENKTKKRKDEHDNK